MISFQQILFVEAWDAIGLAIITICFIIFWTWEDHR